jgi:hypothetical protein
MKVQSAFFAVAAACGMSFGACSSSTPPPDPGGAGGGAGSSGSSTAGTTGTSGGGPVATCDNTTACGGNPKGKWTVSSSCLKLSGGVDLASAGLDPRSCTSAPLTGTLNVTGTFTANADGTYTDDTTTTGNAQVELAPGCLQISGTSINCQGAEVALESSGLTTATCSPSASGGCSCTAVVNQKGSMGMPTATPATSGNFTTSGSTLSLTTDSGNLTHGFCASGSSLTTSPQSMTTTVITGTIALAQDTPNGTGGAGGSASTGGAGGAATAGSTSGGSPTTAGSGGAAGSTGTAGSGGGSGTGSRTDGPCDVYAAANTPCVAAYSMVRGLSKTYTGMLFQVRSGSSAKNTGSGGMLKDIGMTADGYADTAAVDAFCMGTTCTVARLYDQSGNDNHIGVAKKGNTAGGATGGEDDYESSATKGAVMAGGHKVYSLYMAAHEGYRLQAVGKNMPLGSASQGIYEVADGTHVGTACCWDFGNVTTDPTKYGVMNTLFFGKAFWGNGAGNGPWMMADFEEGVWAGGSNKGDPGWGGLSDEHPSNPKNPSLAVPFAMGVLKTSTAQWGLRSADVKSATDLTTSYEGALPKAMNNLGGIVLGVGGDNSNNSWGTFYEGAIVAGYPTAATDLAVLKNVQAVGYSK